MSLPLSREVSILSSSGDMERALLRRTLSRQETMLSPSSVLVSDWFSALGKGNCLLIEMYLDSYPLLIREGWREDLTRDSRGSRLKQGRTKDKTRWIGCTALHKAVLQGSLKLVQRIVDLFSHESEGEWFLDEQDFPLQRKSLSDTEEAPPFPEDAPQFSLGELLAHIDGTYKLEALAIATIQGNRSIISALMDASLKCKSNRYGVIRDHNAEKKNMTKRDDDENQVSQITHGFMASLTESEKLKIELEYSLSTDFNFQKLDLYLFHFTFHYKNRGAGHGQISPGKIQEGILKRTSEALKRFLMVELKDAQGRSALHVAVDGGGYLAVERYLSLVAVGEEYADWVNPPDSAGRTPLYRAAATGRALELMQLSQDSRTGLNTKFFIESYTTSLEASIENCDPTVFESLSERNGFKGYEMNYRGLTALQIAIIHKKTECVRALLNVDRDCVLDVSCQYVYGFHQYDAARDSRLKHWRDVEYSLEPLQLAVMTGEVEIVRLLLEDSRAHDMGRPPSWSNKDQINKETWKMPALHLAAALGQFDIVELLSDKKGIDKLYNPFVQDADGNTALHRAVEGMTLPFNFHLLLSVRADQAAKLPRLEDLARDELEDVQGETRDDSQRVEDDSNVKRGCVELLLQAGLEAWTTNSKDQPPYVGSHASPEFHTWWFKRLAKETLAQQNTMNVAANAISVTAALVATASYVGPLQPPLNYEANAMQTQVTSVRVFIVCDTLSFYFALAAIMLAVIPTIPIPQQPPRMELHQTRRVVTMAVGFLFPSIVCVFVAFAAGSVAVLPDAEEPWRFGGLSISTTITGGATCLFVMYIFCVRLLGLVLYRSTAVKKLYKNSIFFNRTVTKKLKVFSEMLSVLRKK